MIKYTLGGTIDFSFLPLRVDLVQQFMHQGNDPVINANCLVDKDRETIGQNIPLAARGKATSPVGKPISQNNPVTGIEQGLF